MGGCVYGQLVPIQTAGLAFGGTGLCSYRARGVDVSCAKHLTETMNVWTPLR